MAITYDDAAPLRLYFQIKQGQTADAEVIARASLAFIAGVKELAYVIVPSAVVHIGLKGHAEGSLWEDFVILVDKAKAEVEAKPKRYTLALAAIAWILTPPGDRVRDFIWQPILDKYLALATPDEVSAAQKAVELAENGKIANREKQQFYREIRRDTVITGVGANMDRSRPSWIVPQGEFDEYTGDNPVINSALDRSTVGEMRVIILSPVLEVSNRRWKFATALGEFGASVKDKAFLETIVQGRSKVRMRGGVELDVELETKERMVDGVWVITERNVLRVLDIREPEFTRQSDLFPRDSDG